MQAASSPYLPQPYYQNLYHIQPLGPQDYDLKRQYLTLLPPQQIIEICLTFDVHVPPYIKSTIWPQDLHSAITHLRKATDDGVASTSSPSQRDHDKPSEPIMASLERPPEEPNNSQLSPSSTEFQAAERQPPDKAAEKSAPTTATAAPAPTITAAPPIPSQLPYPHQPYGYPPTAYPHAPYYPPPPGYPSYPTSSYPHYPPPVLNGYSHPPQSHPTLPVPHPTHPPPSNSMYPAIHVPQPIHPEQGSDDLPSYEDMIVEALGEFTDPEGCAPKDLFAWMAAKYPLQSNFRPSASQALQKAFKRGRLEKGNNGKYRLSATWEGGSTSKRTTRRPQTQTQQTSAMAGSSGPPFTHAPLIHQQHASPYPGQPYPYPYPGYPGYPQSHPQAQPSLPQPPQAASSETVTTATIAGTTDKSASGFDPSPDVDKDAYEAAQNILKAINFGDLFQIAPEGRGDGKKADDVSIDQLTTLLVQAQSVMSAQMDAAPEVTPPVIPLPTLSASAGVAVAIPTTPEPPTNIRAELQAQLALLAAQLIELSQEHQENVPSSEQAQVGPPPVPELQSQRRQQPLDGHPETQSQALATLDPPLMGTLLPLPDLSLTESQTQIQKPSPLTSAPRTHLEIRLEQPQLPQPSSHQQRDAVPTDQVHNFGGMTTDASTSSVTMHATSSIQPPPNAAAAIEPSPLELASGSATTPTVVASQSELLLPPPPPPPPIFAVPDPAPAPEPTSTSQRTTPHAFEPGPEPPNFMDGETDSEDDDMEEIA